MSVYSRTLRLELMVSGIVERGRLRPGQEELCVATTGALRA